MKRERSDQMPFQYGPKTSGSGTYSAEVDHIHNLSQLIGIKPGLEIYVTTQSQAVAALSPAISSELVACGVAGTYLEMKKHYHHVKIIFIIHHN